jgi:Mor family transcriptional regulator
MSSSDKLKHKILTLSDKAEIIKKLDKGEKLINLAKEYGAGRVTIYDIRKRAFCGKYRQWPQ